MVLQQANILSFPSPIRPSTKAKARKIKFTQTKLEALRHRGGSPEYVYDQNKPGLAVRLTSGGARTFVFVGRLHAPGCRWGGCGEGWRGPPPPAGRPCR